MIAYLKEDKTESLEERWMKEKVRNYSQFIGHPITLDSEKE
jgi:HSP90 family molecular chaperone